MFFEQLHARHAHDKAFATQDCSSDSRLPLENFLNTGGSIHQDTGAFPLQYYAPAPYVYEFYGGIPTYPTPEYSQMFPLGQVSHILNQGVSTYASVGFNGYYGSSGSFVSEPHYAQAPFMGLPVCQGSLVCGYKNNPQNVYTCPNYNDQHQISAPTHAEGLAIEGSVSAPMMKAVMPIGPPFRPSRALTDEPRQVAPDVFQQIVELGLDINPNYQGEIDLENATLPEHLNCCIFVKDIPAYAGLKEVLSSIFEGKIFTSKLYPPVKGQFDTCAAKIAFTTREAAEALFYRANYGIFGMRVFGKRVTVMWNRDKSRAVEYSQSRQSRVVRIWGPRTFPTDEVVKFFHDNIAFELVDRREWVVAGDMKVLELHFPSILGQSRAAMKCFLEYKKIMDQNDRFAICYAPDPCNRDNYPDRYLEYRR